MKDKDAKRKFKQIKEFQKLLGGDDIATHLEAIADKILVSNDTIFQSENFKYSLLLLIELKLILKAA